MNGRRPLSDVIGSHSRWIFAILRRFQPVLTVAGYSVVSRSESVHAVLADAEGFGVPSYNRKMVAITGPFFLGLPDDALYRHDRAALRAAVRHEDLAAIDETTVKLARATVSRGGDLDIVRELTEPVTEALIASYLGVPSPQPGTLARWSRTIFQDIFLNTFDNARVHRIALHDAAEMRVHVDNVVRARKAAVLGGHAVPDDVLTRLLVAQPDPGGLHDVSIRHNLIGVISGWLPTLSKAFALAVQELLNRPSELGAARAAAEDGQRVPLAGYLLEALRFRPQTWALLRECSTDRAIEAGEGATARIRSGTKVICGTQSAMFDWRTVPAPGEFIPTRPDADYLHFGHGLHACFGEQLVRTQLPAMATALLEHGAISRVPGRAGRLHWEGAYPAQLLVRLPPGN